jgi:hypothetical protein
MNFAKIHIRGCKDNLQLSICILHLHSGACKQYLQSVLGIFWNYWPVSIETGGVFGGGFNTRLIEKTSATTNALVLNGWLSNSIHYTGDCRRRVSSDSGAIQIPSLP